MTFRREDFAEGVTLYCGDCRDVMPTLGQFDAVVTDPPYGIDENDAKIASRGKLAAPINYGKMDWDKAPPCVEIIRQIQDCSRHQVIFGGNYFDGLGPTSCWLIWDKQNGDNDFADCELAWTNLQKAVRRIYWRWNGMIRRGDDIREHPTQKPVGVMRWCLEQLPADAHSVCDPFMGSGTTGVAAVGLGKSFTGIEREPRYFDMACRRISDALSRPDLFIASPKPIEKQEALL